METVAIAELSSTGGIMIPPEVITKMGLHSGDKFVLFGHDDVLTMKMVHKPTRPNLDKLLKESRKMGKEKGIKPSDIKKMIKETRDEIREQKRAHHS